MMLSEDLNLDIDGGGTSTTCLLTDKHGHALTQVRKILVQIRVCHLGLSYA